VPDLVDDPVTAAIDVADEDHLPDPPPRPETSVFMVAMRTLATGSSE
jgi:hypothetical protein